jgi:hypothetical protein
MEYLVILVTIGIASPVQHPGLENLRKTGRTETNVVCKVLSLLSVV